MTSNLSEPWIFFLWVDWNCDIQKSSCNRSYILRTTLQITMHFNSLKEKIFNNSKTWFLYILHFIGIPLIFYQGRALGPLPWRIFFLNLKLAFLFMEMIEDNFWTSPEKFRFFFKCWGRVLGGKKFCPPPKKTKEKWFFLLLLWQLPGSLSWLLANIHLIIFGHYHLLTNITNINSILCKLKVFRKLYIYLYGRYSVQIFQSYSSLSEFCNSPYVSTSLNAWRRSSNPDILVKDTWWISRNFSL